jgi:hypothetical protein
LGKTEILRTRLVAQSRDVLKANRITKSGFLFTQMSCRVKSFAASRRHAAKHPCHAFNARGTAASTVSIHVNDRSDQTL